MPTSHARRPAPPGRSHPFAFGAPPVFASQYFDANSDGVLTPEEFSTALTALSSLSIDEGEAQNEPAGQRSSLVLLGGQYEPSSHAIGSATAVAGTLMYSLAKSRFK